MSIKIILILLFSILAGCAGGASPQYYLLQADPQPRQINISSANLAIDSMEITGFLDKSGIVYQTEPGKVNVAVSHLWAEPLDSQIRRKLVNHLSSSLKDVSVYKNTAIAPRESVRLSMSIDGFHGRYDGVAIISGIWWLADPAGNVITRKSFNQSIPLENDGYTELVRSLSIGLKEVAEIIATEFKIL